MCGVARGELIRGGYFLNFLQRSFSLRRSNLAKGSAKKKAIHRWSHGRVLGIKNAHRSYTGPFAVWGLFSEWDSGVVNPSFPAIQIFYIKQKFSSQKKVENQSKHTKTRAACANHPRAGTVMRCSWSSLAYSFAARLCLCCEMYCNDGCDRA